MTRNVPEGEEGATLGEAVVHDEEVTNTSERRSVRQRDQR